MDFTQKIDADLNRLLRLIEQDLKEIIGVEAVNFFSESFDNQGFTDQGLEKWPEVKRREPKSSWYGFKYGARTKKPGNHPSRKASTKKYKARKANPVTNYSPTATKTPILSSQQSQLENSLQWRTSGGKVIIYSDVPYADAHNEGATIKVFGGKTAKLPQRKFVGNSAELERRIKEVIKLRMQQIKSSR